MGLNCVCKWAGVPESNWHVQTQFDIVSPHPGYYPVIRPYKAYSALKDQDQDLETYKTDMKRIKCILN